jgi:alkylated DNA repair dioxygenase AlkB
MTKQIYSSDKVISSFTSGINAFYHPNYILPEVQTQIIDYLNHFRYSQVHYPKFGKERYTPRQTYCYGQFKNEPIASYRGKSFQTEPIPEWLNQLKTPIEEWVGLDFNAVIMNRYSSGQEYIGWHQDDETFLEHQTIASVTLGADRAFQFRSRPKESIQEITLRSGSLLLFSDGLLHSLPKRARVNTVRYNITFRKVNSNRGIGNYYYYNRGNDYAL